VHALVLGVTVGMVGVGNAEGLDIEEGMFCTDCVQLEPLLQPTADPLLSSFTDHTLEGDEHDAPLFHPFLLLPQALVHAGHEIPLVPDVPAL